MGTKVIAYDLNRETNRPRMAKKIKDTYGNWARLSESCYAVDTSDSADAIFAKLKPLIDSNDNLYVVGLKRPWNGFGPKDVNDWLDDNLDS
jgi:CRISPR/Cas system-associated endoribonuclease Cas2